MPRNYKITVYAIQFVLSETNLVAVYLNLVLLDYFHCAAAFACLTLLGFEYGE